MQRFLIYLCCCLIILCSSFAQATVTVDIDIHGLTDDLLKNAKANLSLRQKTVQNRLNNTTISISIENGIQEIKTALQPFGYYDATVTVSSSQRKAHWRVVYTVEKGPPIIVRTLKIDVQGEAIDIPEIAKLSQQFPLKIGDRLSQYEYDKFKAQLSTLLLNLGFFDVKYSQQAIIINPTIRKADIKLVAHSGKRYRIGKIHFQQDAYDHDFLARFLLFHSNQLYDLETIQQTQRRMEQVSFFSVVEITPQLEQRHDHVVPVEITITPEKKLQLEAGLGYGTDSGYRGQLGFNRRRITEYAHRLSNKNLFSEFKDQIALQYSIPGSDPVFDSTVLSVAYIDDRPEKRNIDAISKQLTISRLTGDMLTAHQRNFTISIQNDTFDTTTRSEETSLLMPSIQWQWVRANDRLVTKHGYRAQLELRGSSKAIFSDVSFLQILLSAKNIYSLNADWRFIQRGKVGLSWLNVVEQLPPSLRFFAGGDNSVRGYGYQALGPKGDNRFNKTVVIGGRHLTEASIEIERRLLTNWRAAIFYDVGNAFDRFSERLRHGLGVGLRWQSPVGLVRVDLAVPISENAQGLRLHFNLGPDL